MPYLFLFIKYIREYLLLSNITTNFVTEGSPEEVLSNLFEGSTICYCILGNFVH